MRSRLLPLLLCLLLAGAVACGYRPAQRISRLTPAPAASLLRTNLAQSAAPSCTTVDATKPPATGSHAATIANAYQAILRNYIHPLDLDSTSLLNAAWKGAMDESAKEGDSDPGVAAPQLSDSSPDADWQTFASAYDTLSLSTDGRVDQIKLAFASIAEMAKSVDEGHTYFFPPEEYASLGKDEILSGGIGVQLNGKKVPFVVQEVVKGAPADQAGIRPGDTLTAVDGCDVASWDSLQLVTRVRGTAGTGVHLAFNRVTSGGFEVDITRAQVTFPAITSQMLPQQVGYVHMHSFPDSLSILAGGKPVGPALLGILSSFQTEGAKSWILDLRGNGGGAVDGVQILGGLILPPGTIFSATDRAGHRSVLRTAGNRVTDPPLLAILVDEGSASASEIMSAAIQDDRVAPVVGSPTAGFANEATAVGIGDGAGVSVTVAQTYTPSGRPLGNNGVVPDIVVERTATDLAAGQDPPLDLALQLPLPTATGQPGSGP